MLKVERCLRNMGVVAEWCGEELSRVNMERISTDVTECGLCCPCQRTKCPCEGYLVLLWEPTWRGRVGEKMCSFVLI